MHTRWKIITAALSTALLLSVGTGTAQAENHSHSHDAAKPAQLTLHNGQKWVTDKNLRQGMGNIHGLLAAELPAIHSGKITLKQYQALARKINEQTEFIVKNCKLDQETDAMLHLVLADIMNGAEAMTGKGDHEAHQGAVKIINALDNYATFFDHPGWQHAGAQH